MLGVGGRGGGVGVGRRHTSWDHGWRGGGGGCQGREGGKERRLHDDGPSGRGAGLRDQGRTLLPTWSRWMAIARRLIYLADKHPGRKQGVEIGPGIPTALSTSCCLHFGMVPADGSPRGRIHSIGREWQGCECDGLTLALGRMGGHKQPLPQPRLSRSEEDHIHLSRWGRQQ